jgi:hypothetical protein
LCEWLLCRSLVWGGLGAFAFHVLVVRRLDHASALYNAVAGEEWQLKAVISLLFLTGVASLVLRLLRVVVEMGAVERFQLPAADANATTIGAVETALHSLNQAPASLRERSVVKRLHAALEHLKHAGTAESLTAHLHQLAHADRRQMTADYSGMRAVTMAIPLVGLLGALSRGGAALGALSTGSSPTAASAIANAHVALDMIAATIAAAVLLVFAKMAVERVELRLLKSVDAAAQSQLLSRFRHHSASGDPTTASVMHLCEKVLETVNTAVAQHDAAVSRALGSATRRWEESASTAAALLHRTVGDALAAGLKDHARALNDGVGKHSKDLEGVLVRHAQILSDNVDQHTHALADALEHHTAVITQTETNLAAENRRHLGELEGALGEAVLLASTRQEALIQQSENLLREMQAALIESASTSVAQQEQLIRQGEVMLRVVEATAHVRKLEEALNENLTALAASHRFEETVVGLSAALQLLSTKLGRQLVVRDDAAIESKKPASQAA